MFYFVAGASGERNDKQFSGGVREKTHGFWQILKSLPMRQDIYLMSWLEANNFFLDSIFRKKITKTALKWVKMISSIFLLFIKS